MTAQPRDQQQRSPLRRRRAGPQAGFRRTHSAPLRHAAYARASAMCATGEELRALSGEQREQRAATRMPESDQGSAGSLSAGLRWAAGQFAAGRWSATESARPKGAAKGRATRAARHLWEFVTLPINPVVSGRCGLLLKRWSLTLEGQCVSLPPHRYGSTFTHAPRMRADSGVGE